MARPKEFDRDEAVRRAMGVFWEKGYEATSTDDLLRAMGIGRQSMYDTFGDKHRLYLEALQRYQAESAASLMERLRAEDSPLAAVERVLMAIASESAAERARGCMGVNAIAELAQKDAEVASVSKSAAMTCEAAFERVVQQAKRRGEVPPSVDARQAGRFLLNALQGLRVTAKAGAPPAALREVATFTVASLRAR
ncbi:TetR/AcrR family transcriptional regulator [Myxococcus sp. K15C18031901]|uniref:TetR/AcrR family transcriptional regulator n=1 Tax=Myxococcus dinghuensis TaxID=2906761 RepID=UPI0020A785BD|nr:TetR/AcrR family transcriptional regulator [Myxococcus dinghuensis]MCP3104480.1 TetR/AcrR family transcriptional regulator [Myxococcus dinghuensis]